MKDDFLLWGGFGNASGETSVAKLVIYGEGLFYAKQKADAEESESADFSPGQMSLSLVHCRVSLRCVGDVSFLSVATLRAHAVFIQFDAAEGAAVDAVSGGELAGGSVHAAGEGEFHDVEFVFEQVIDNFNHAFHGHGFFCHHEAAVGIGGREFRFERRTLHRVLRVAVFDALFFIDVKNGGQQRVVFAQNQSVVKVLEQAPSHLLDFVAGIDHVHAFVHGVFDFNGEDAGVTVKILCFALESVETVSVLEI